MNVFPHYIYKGLNNIFNFTSISLNKTFTTKTLVLGNIRKTDIRTLTNHLKWLYIFIVCKESAVNVVSLLFKDIIKL